MFVVFEMSDVSRIVQLLVARHRGELADADRLELEAWVLAMPGRASVVEELDSEEAIRAVMEEIEGVDMERIRSRVLERMPGAFGMEEAQVVEMGRRWGRRVWWIAAVLLLLLGTGVWWVVNDRVVRTVMRPVAVAPAIAAPGVNRATLTLAGGQVIDLDSAGNGRLAQQGIAQVVKLGNGKLAYSGGALHHGELLYNFLVNPRGSQVVSLTLSDGTKVWLNAESSLRYPAAFVGDSREVEVVGEAYFEVAATARQPFRVKMGDTSIEVLGTGFNVNGYADEAALRVTLVDGKVRVSAAGEQRLLKPGEQAVVAKGIGLDRSADIGQVLAWKNGLFAFQRADLPTVMRQLSRWYDLEVRYESAVPSLVFTGELQRTLSFEQVMKILAGSKVHYTIEDRHHITIRP